MAKLSSTPAPGHWFQCDEKTGVITCGCSGLEEHWRKEAASLRTLEQEAEKNTDSSVHAGFIFSYPVADGHALYRVLSTKPLVLQHIPFGDAYQIPRPMMRGLRLSDIQLHKNFNRLWASLVKEDDDGCTVR